jgi:hypothetical protein
VLLVSTIPAMRSRLQGVKTCRLLTSTGSLDLGSQFPDRDSGTQIPSICFLFSIFRAVFPFRRAGWGSIVDSYTFNIQVEVASKILCKYSPSYSAPLESSLTSIAHVVLTQEEIAVWNLLKYFSHSENSLTALQLQLYAQHLSTKLNQTFNSISTVH